MSIILCLLIPGCRTEEPLQTEMTYPDYTVEYTSPYSFGEEVYESSETTQTAQPAEGIDMDLTTMSSTMVYANVYSLISYPDDYLGQTIKMEGVSSSFHSETNGNYYFACVIQDAAACCSQGIEYELTEEFINPDDYPSDGDQICVVGVFDMYEEDGMYYVTLRDAQLLEE